MAPSSQHEVIEEINQRVDPRDLLNKINFEAEQIAVVGAMLKAFCPIHAETKFKTLLVDLNKKTFKCSYRPCPGSKGGSLVEFFGLYQGIATPLQAAFGLAKFLNLELEASFLRRLCVEFVEEGRKTLDQGKLEEATEYVVHALDIDPENVDAHLLASHLANVRGAIGDAIEHAQRAAAVAESRGDTPKAIEILTDHVLDLLPEDEEALLHLADLQESMGDVDKCVDLVLRVAHAREARGEVASLIPLFARILGHRPDRHDTRLSLARAHEASGEPDRAAENFLLAVDLLEQDDRPDEALSTLHHVRELQPANWTARERILEYLARAGKEEEQASELQSVADLALERGEIDRAEGYIRKVLDHTPQSLDARETLARILEGRGDLAAFAREKLVLADLYAKEGRTEDVLNALRTAREASPDDASVRERFIDQLLEDGKTGEAASELIGLGRLHFDLGQLDEGSMALARLAEVAPEDFDVRMKAIDLLEEQGMRDRAAEECRRMAETLAGHKRWEDVLGVSERGLGLEPASPELRRAHIESLRSLDRVDDAVEEYRILVDLLIDQGEEKGAETAIEEALQLSPDHIEIQQVLVDLYLRSERKEEALIVLKNLTRALGQKGKRDALIATCDRLLGLNPDDLDTRILLAEQYLEKGLAAEASEEFERVGDQYARDGKFEEARAIFDRVIGIDPGVLEVLRKTADLVAAHDSVDAAKPYFQSILGVIRGRDDAKALDAEYLAILGQHPGWSGLRSEYAEWLLEQDRKEEAYRQFVDLAEDLCERQGDLDAAALVYARLVESEPENLDFHIGLGRLHERKGDTDNAASAKGRAVDLLLAANRNEEALDLLEEIVHLVPSDEAVRLRLVDLLFLMDRKDGAVEQLREIASLRRSRDREEENIEIYRRILDLDADQLETRRLLAEALETGSLPNEAAEQWLALAEGYEIEGRLSEAVEVCRHVIELDPEDATPRLRLAGLFESMGDVASVKEEYDGLVALYRSQGAHDQAVEALRKMIALDADDLTLPERLGRVFEEQGKQKEACELYFQTARRHRDQDEGAMARALLVRIKTIEPDRRDARETLAEICESLGDLRGAARERLDLAQMAFDASDLTAANAQADQVTRLAGEDWDLVIELAHICSRHQQHESAVRQLSSAVERALEKKDSTGGLTLTREAVRLSPDSRDLHESRVEFLRLADKTDEAVEEYRTLSEIAVREGDTEAAALYDQSLIELAPRDIPAHQHLADLMLELDDKAEAVRELTLVVGLQTAEERTEEAIETAGRILQLEPDNDAARSARVELCMKSGRGEQAAEDLDVLADHASKAEEWGKAEGYLRRVLTLSPESLDAVRKLARVILEYRPLEDARPVFQRRLELTSLLLAPEDLVAEYEEVLRLDGRNPDFHLEFARVLREQGQSDRAAKSFAAAADLWEKEKELDRTLEVLIELGEYRPKDFSVAARKGRVLLAMDRRDEARQTFVEAGEGLIAQGSLAEGVGAYLQALQIDPNDESLLLRVASLYEESGTADQARELYLRVANLRDQRGATNECLETYGKLLALDPNDLEIQRRLADAHETLGHAELAVREWIAFADKAEALGENPKAISACLHIKEIDPTARENRKRLIRYYLGMGEQEAVRQETTDLADICEGLGDLGEVETILTEAIESDPTSRAFRRRLAEFYAGQRQTEQAVDTLSALARLCLDEQDTTEAIETYRRVAELKPDDFGVRQSIIEILAVENRVDEAAAGALALAESYLEADADDEALEWAEKAIEFERDQIQRVLDAVELLRLHSREDAARDLLLRRVGAFLTHNQPDRADELVAKGLEWYAGHPDVLAARIKTQTALGDPVGALESCKLLARSYREAGNAPEEETVWNQALELDPEDVESHEGLAGVLESFGTSRLADTLDAILRLSALHAKAERPRRAIECHRKCLELDSERNDVREALAQMLLDTGDWPSALEEYLDLAQRHLETKDVAKARVYFEKVLELDNENLDALRILIRVTRELGDHPAHIRYNESLAAIYTQGSAFGDAIQCYRDLLDFSPDHIAAWETLGGLLEQEGLIDEAVQVWNRLCEHYELGDDPLAAIGILQKIERRKPDDLATARKIAELSADTKDPAAPQRFRRVLDLAEQAGETEQAIAAATKILEYEKENPLSHRDLARLLKDGGRNKEAVAALVQAAALHEAAHEMADAADAVAEILDIAPDNSDQREHFARLLQDAGDNDRAVEQILILAEVYEKQGNLQKAIARGRDALALDPLSLEAHIRLHRYHTARAEAPLALAEVNWLADHFAEAEEYDKVRAYLESGLQLDPQNMGLLERLAEMHMELGQLDEATSQYLRIAEAALVRGESVRATKAMELARDCSPDDVEIRRNLAEIYVRQGDADSARSEFFEVARLYLAQGLVADARGTLDALIIQTPKDIELRERIASLYVEHGIPELAALQYVELARLRKQANDPDGVIQYTKEALALKPRTIEAKELQVEAQIQLADLDGAYQTYSDMAELYTQTGQPERAANCLRPMIELQPDEPEPRQRLIEIFQRLNRPDAAVEEMRQLAALHAAAGRTEEAVAAYRAILETRPDDTRARVAYIQTYSQIGPERDLVDDYIKLASIFVSHKSIPQAVQAYEKALAIAPDNREHREAFVDLLLAHNQLDRAQKEADTLSASYMEDGANREALALLQKILKVAPESTRLRLRLAETHSRLNARGMALKELRFVAKAYEKANDASGLIDTYRQILDIDPQNVDTRQQLIELLELEHRLDEAAEQHMQLADVFVGRGLLDSAREEYRGLTRLQPENLTAWNYLVATREQLGEEEGLADDYLALGQLYENMDQGREALENYRKAVETESSHLEARRQYIETYKKTGKETDLIDDYLALADILISRNLVDEAVEVYSHVMALDPNNETAKKRLVDTQARRAGLASSAAAKTKPPATPKSEPAAPASPVAPVSPVAPAPAPSAQHPPTPVPADTPTLPVDTQPDAEPEAEEMPEIAEEEAGLEQVVANYQDILQVNAQNANVRLKLADLYDQMGRQKESIKELVKASEIFFQKSELNMCVTVCERILSKDPSNGKVRERLSKAVLKRDAFKALESAILFSDQASQTDTDPKRISDDGRDTI